MLTFSMYLLTLNKEHASYRKPDNDLIYIHKHSNRPQNIFRDLPKSISKKVTDTSSNEETFNNHIPIYREALKSSAFNNYLSYRQSQQISTHNSRIQEKQKKCNRKIIWFNPTFSTNVKMNIGKILFELLPKHFHKMNKLYKIFNRNTVKISYNCMRNMGFIISAHNQCLLTLNDSSFRCNCRNKSNCPLEDIKCYLPCWCDKWCWWRMQVLLWPKKVVLFPEISRVKHFYHSTACIVESEYIFLTLKQKRKLKNDKTTKSKRN